MFAVDCIAAVTVAVAVTWSLAGPLRAVGVQTTAASQPQTAWVLIILASIAWHLVAEGQYMHRVAGVRELRFVEPAGRLAGYASQPPGYRSLLASLSADATGSPAAAAVEGFHRGPDDQVSDRSAPLPAVPGLGAVPSWHRPGRTGALRPAVAGDGQSDREPDPRDAPTREDIPFAATRFLAGRRGSVARLAGQEMPIRWPARDAPARIQTVAKSLMDVTFAATALLLTSPVLVAIALIIRLDGGPALFRHRRLGFQGRHFYCLKFRTMIAGAEQALQHALANDPAVAAEWNATHKLKQDPRTTRIGAFLRRSSLDELPQLINVLWRDMSLVGPRPITDPEVHHYGNAIHYYYTARPGITGLWQVSGRSDTTYEQRVQLDVQYVTRWSLWHDLVLLFRTIPAVINRKGAH